MGGFRVYLLWHTAQRSAVQCRIFARARVLMCVCVLMCVFVFVTHVRTLSTFSLSLSRARALSLYSVPSNGPVHTFKQDTTIGAATKPLLV